MLVIYQTNNIRKIVPSICFIQNKLNLKKREKSYSSNIFFEKGSMVFVFILIF